MAYIKKDDYTLRVPLKYLDDILEQAAEEGGLTVTDILEDAEQTAYSEIGSYLAGRYIIENEFNKDATTSPDPRNKDILKCALDIALFHLNYTISPRDIPLTREKAYDSCLEKLAAYRDAKLIIYPIHPEVGGIEPRPIGEGDERINLQSHVKFISRPYNDPSGLEETTP